MITFNYTLTTRSRLSAGAAPEVLSSRRAHTVIPGATVRGALASAWVIAHGESWESQAFRTLFERRLVVRQAVPDGVELVPMSRVTCKYPLPPADFLPSPCKQHTYDRALAFAYGGQQQSNCPSCGGSWEAGRGWNASGLPTVYSTRTELVKGVARDENLFTRRALERRTVLRGTLLLNEDVASPDDLDWFSVPRRIRVGGQRSVLGDAEFVATRADPPARTLQPGPDGLIVLRARSPIILATEGGAASTDAEGELRKVLGAQAAVVAEWVRPVQVSGWHMASGLPKPQEWALEAGSTFVVSGAPTDTRALLHPGLGLRRNEGYGEIEVVDGGTHVPDVVATTEASEAGQTSSAERPTPSTVVEKPAEAEPETSAVDVRTPEVAEARTRARAISLLLDELIAKLGPQVASTGVRGVAAGLSRTRLARQNGFPDATAQRQIDEVLRLPWARELSPEAVRTVRELLGTRSPTVLGAIRAELEIQATERGL